MVERSLSMREVLGSIPSFSIVKCKLLWYKWSVKAHSQMCTSQYHLWKKTGIEQLFLYVLTAWSDSLQCLLDPGMIAVTFLGLMGIELLFLNQCNLICRDKCKCVPRITTSAVFRESRHTLVFVKVYQFNLRSARHLTVVEGGLRVCNSCNRFMRYLWRCRYVVCEEGYDIVVRLLCRRWQ